MKRQDSDAEACFICWKHRGDITLPGGVLYEDDLVSVGHMWGGEGPAYLGYLMVELKRHVPGLADQTDEEAQALGVLVARLSRALKASEGAEHIYLFVFGDHVPHLHMHLVPRYPGTPQAYWGTRVDEWPDAPRGDASVVEVVCERLRQWLAQEQVRSQ
ncbi:HIT family protein [Tengunoibacter tsumagoiensis]|uniref:HIT family protein n=1 Tax=Tengunoibacter tsumagoiensis TaxID=2014871 RepID=A0A402A004_9CHLR|nr:HIT family protein [Tengunoibacter tsumagoiensis]GCE12477.1 HIT family protein [Tengunoibacter tsumagoiensis]